MVEELEVTEPNWELYRALREQWVHEDNLINHRMTWHILSNGLLLTAFGILLRDGTRVPLLSIPAIGMFMSFLVGAAIYAATDAMYDIRRIH